MTDDPDAMERAISIAEFHDVLDYFPWEYNNQLKVVVHSRRGTQSKRALIDDLSTVGDVDDRSTSHGRRFIVVDVGDENP